MMGDEATRVTARRTATTDRYAGLFMVLLTVGVVSVWSVRDARSVRDGRGRMGTIVGRALEDLILGLARTRYDLERAQSSCDLILNGVNTTLSERFRRSLRWER